MAIFTPYTFAGVLGILIAVLAFEPRFKTSIISVIPEQNQTLAFKLFWLFDEFLFYGHAGMLSMLGSTTHVLCFEKYLQTIRSLKTSIKATGIEGSRTKLGQQSYKGLRKLQLNVMLFNEGNSYLIFTFKLLCIYLAVSCGLGAIYCFDYNKSYVLLSGLLCCDIIGLYGIVYEKAFAIPTGVESLRNELLVIVHKKRTTLLRREGMIMLRKIRSIPNFGIRVGDFHMMERTSTPIFIDFVIRNVVNLLVLLRQ